MSTPTQKPIRKCDSANAFTAAGKNAADFKELVLERSGAILADIKAGTTSKPHEFEAVEIAAQSVARFVLDEGAARIASRLNVDLRQLKALAAEEHITGC